jgi:hypothetical protein
MKAQERLREAIKQVQIAAGQVEHDIYPELFEASIRLRGIADRLEEEAQIDEDLDEMIAMLDRQFEGSSNEDVKSAINDIADPDSG